MSSDQGPRPAPRARTDFIPPVVFQSISVGAFSGTLGALFGAVTAVLRGRPALFSATLAAANWFTIGTTYYGSSSLVTTAWERSSSSALTSKDRIMISTVAGAFTGAAQEAFMRGSRKVPQATLAFSIFGAAGQAVVGALPAREPSTTPERGWMASKWSPLKSLSDKEYEDLIQEKMLRLDAEIALVDERIAHLRSTQDQEEPQA